MIKVSGYSDDLIEIEGGTNSKEIDSYDKDTLIAFSDGTILRMSYGGPCGTWRANVERNGRLSYTIRQLVHNGDYYSDLFETEASYIIAIWQEDSDNE